MNTYEAQWRYNSSLGSFAEGDKVQLTEEAAAAFNRDSPGVLQLYVPEQPPAVKGRVETGSPQDRMMRPAAVQKREVEATPAAVKLAGEHGIDLAEVKGTGAGGKVVKSDIEALIEG